MDQLLRRLADLNAATMPGGRIPFLLGAEQVGWLSPALAEAVAEFDDVQAGPAGVVLEAPASLPAIARTLARMGIAAATVHSRADAQALRHVVGPLETPFERERQRNQHHGGAQACKEPRHQHRARVLAVDEHEHGRHAVTQQRDQEHDIVAQ